VLTSKQRLSFFFERTREHDLFGPDGAASSLPEPLGGNPGYNRSDVYRLSWDYTLSPTLLNRFYAGATTGSRTMARSTPTAARPNPRDFPPYRRVGRAKICIPNYPNCDDDFPQVNFTNSEFTNWGVAAPNGSDNIVVEFHDDMTKSLGSHTFKWGYFYNNTHYNGFGLQNISGNVTFQNLNTGVPLNTSQATGGGSAFASFLLGQVSGYSLDTPRYLATEFRSHEAYFQDDWRVSQRLTLNLGLRFELSLPLLVGDNQASDLSPSTPNPGAGGLPGALVFAGSGPGRIGSDTLTSGWNGWGPRLGFAYGLNNKTTIRGAASRSFGPLTYEGSSSHNLGIVQRITVSDQSQGLNPLWVLQNGAPAWAQVPISIPPWATAPTSPITTGKRPARHPMRSLSPSISNAR